MIQLLGKIKILNKYQNQISNLSEERFNIFRICGVNHYEVTHSSIITELLSNNSSHNFGTKFLDAFIQTLIKDKIIDDDYFFSLQDIKVIPEHSVGEFGRIDILITNINQCIIIENKIYANDQQNQLKRYETFAKQNFKNHLLLYLTLYGDEASEFSAKDSDYKLISYGQTMINWLERCVEIAAKNPVIRETLIQYINHLKYLTNNTTLSKMNDEIIEILSLNENIDATFTIGERLNDVKNHLVNKNFLHQLNNLCLELGLELDVAEYDRINTAYSSFIIFHPKWKTFKIGFEFEARGLRNLITGIVHKDREIRNDETFNKLKKYFKNDNEFWVWSPFPKYPNWNKEAMIAITDGGMISIFKDEIEKILSITENLEM